MTKRTTKQGATHTRLPVSLTEADNALAMRLKHAMENRLGKRLSFAEVIRTAMRTQADVEGVVYDCQK